MFISELDRPMTRLFLPFCLAMAITSTACADWRKEAPICAEEIAKQTQCASCNGYWREIARCAIQRSAAGISSEAINSCIAAVERLDANLPLGHDRVADTVACLSR